MGVLIPDERNGAIRRTTYPIIGAIVLLCLLLASSTSALRPNTTIDPCAGHEVTAKQVEQFAEAVWRLPNWERGQPPRRVLRAYRFKLACAVGAGHRTAIKATWERDRRQFRRYRAFRQVAPYPGGGTYWAIPFYIVDCESGGDWGAYNPSGASGPYQLLGWGAPYPATTWREKMENHRIARELWLSQGSSPWVCA